MTTGKYVLIHPQMLDALDRLRDPEQTICCSLKRSGVPGMKELQDATFPPKHVDREWCLAGYEFLMEGDVTFELTCQVLGYCTDGGGEYSMIGFVSHRQMQGWREIINPDPEVTAESCFVAVRYFAGSREGDIYISRDLYRMFELVMSKELYWARCRVREKHEEALRAASRAA